MPKRTLLLTIILLAGIAAVGTRIYFFWQQGIGNLPAVVMQHRPPAVAEAKQQHAPQPLTPTEIIVAADEEFRSAGHGYTGLEPLRNTAGGKRWRRARAARTVGGAGRLKIGDVIEGFRLSRD